MLFDAPDQFSSRDATPLLLRVIVDAHASLTPAAARAALQGTPTMRRYDTKLLEYPVWLLVDSVPTERDGQRPHMIEFPSRHAQTLACWNAVTMTALGEGDRTHNTGSIIPVKAGFAIRTDPTVAPGPVLCRGTFSGPAYIDAFMWQTEDLKQSARKFQENAALISGGLITLSIFVFVTAMINREWTYVIFAVWLIGNLRICANAMGWDA
ncbi:conserved hypothetical protein, partial [Ricinus communis]